MWAKGTFREKEREIQAFHYICIKERKNYGNGYTEVELERVSERELDLNLYKYLVLKCMFI